MLGKQRGKCLTDGRRALIPRRQRQQLLAAGQIADGKDVGIGPVDTAWSLGEVDGPDGTNCRPLERVDVGASRPVTIAAKQVRQLSAGDPGELLRQAGNADARSRRPEVGQNILAGGFRHSARPSTAELAAGASVVDLSLPVTQRARR